MSLIRKHGAVLQAWACLALVVHAGSPFGNGCHHPVCSFCRKLILVKRNMKLVDNNSNNGLMTFCYQSVITQIYVLLYSFRYK